MTNPQDYLASAQAGLSVDQRIALARKMMDGPVGSDARGIAHKLVLQSIINDAEVRVRQALAETLAASPDAPREAVLALANDVDLVAVPILSASEVLKPEDFVRIIDGPISQQKLGAIAGRAEVPWSVAMAVAGKADARTAGVLLQNPGAEILEQDLHRIIDHHGSEEHIKRALVDRDTLPVTVIERMVALLSSALLTRLISQHQLSGAVAARLALDTRNRAVLGLTTGLAPEAMSALAEQLFEEDRLTPSLLIRSLCSGNLDFLIYGLAARLRVSTDYVRKRLHGDATSELAEVWRRAELPPQYLPLAGAAVAVLRLSQADSVAWSVDQYRGQIVERMRARCSELGVKIAKDDLDYLIAASHDAGAELKDLVSAATPQ